jgi:hypothetical protein
MTYSDLEGSRTMNSRTEVMPPETSSVSSANWKQGLFTAAFLIIAAVAMIGWSIALGWAAIRLGSMDVFLIS